TYLALDVPRWRDITISVAGLAAIVVAADGVTLALGRDLVPAFQLEMLRSAQAGGSQFWVWLTVSGVAPIGEEILFRGFMFRGLVREPRDALPGILVISLIWAILHVGSYDWFGISLVFVVGVLLGCARYFSGSTTLAILLHVLLNFESLAETAVVLGS